MSYQQKKLSSPQGTSYSSTDRRDGVDVNDTPADQERDSTKEKVHHFLLQIDGFYGLFMKWSLSILLVLFLTFIVFGILYSGVHYQSTCATPFGTILGVHNGVFGYSNCNDDYVSGKGTMVKLPNGKEQYTGMKWQCVEYARRYWMLAGQPEPAFFGDVDIAEDIWSLKVVYSVSNPSKTFPLQRYSTTSGPTDRSFPQAGDIMIYRKESPSFPAGHIVVVVQVRWENNNKKILLAEQNWDSEPWPAPYHNYSRSIPFVHNDADGSYSVRDDVEGHILGWMRYGE